MSSPFEFDNVIELAGIKINCDNHKVPWKRNFEDQENTFSLHRWNFLLTMASCYSPSAQFLSWGEQQIEEWTCDYLDQKQGLSWSSYTVGERICNGALFYILHKKQPSKKIVEALAAFADRLLISLEYHGENFTGNHVFNNARALYYAGQCLGVESWCSISKLIIKREINKLITEDGFLREGSSHYHFLFTRWALEILMLAQEFDDSNFLSCVEPYVKSLVRQCWFFLVWNDVKREWTIPLIGDISPDFSPKWLLDVPWSNLALSLYKPGLKLPVAPWPGWASLLGRTENETDKLPECKDVYDYCKSGWYRIKCGELLLFIHAEPQGTPDFPGHCHSDVGSFCLYVKGVPLFVDSGRFDYSMNELSKYGVSAQSHNTVCVDGYECFPFIDRRWYPKIYRSKNVRVTIEKVVYGFDVHIYMDGFERIQKDNISVIRKFIIRERSVEIEDIFQGSGKHKVESRFHFAPEILVEKSEHNNKYCLQGDFGRAEFCLPQKTNQSCEMVKGGENPPGGWFFPKYGEKQQTTTLSFCEQNKLPAKANYQLFLK